LNKKIKLFISAFSLFFLSILIVVFYFYNHLLGQGISEDTTEVLFDVNTGQSMNSVAEQLQRKNLIKNAKVFSLYARAKGMAHKLKRGEYSLNQTMNALQILSVITSGKSVSRNLTIAEGLNVFDIAEILEKNNYGTRQEALRLFFDRDFIKSLLNEDLESLEGYLFPETYKVTKFDTQKEIIIQMVKRFLFVYSELQPEIDKFQVNYPHRKWSRNQLITFASIVEKETGASHERALVSSVFHNRLDKNMKLQTDPTVIYGASLIKGEVIKNITKNDLLTPTRHNTYTNYGLPPTPISNPGREAIIAAMNPVKTNYLFFVSHNDGTHKFSENLEDHNSAVKTFQLNPKAREGKSWRDLGKQNENDKGKSKAP